MRKKLFLFWFVLISLALAAGARDITFCGERIPVDNAFVAKKLMDIIRSQLKYVDLPGLRRDAQRYFPMIEYVLKKCNMPDDLKYIPIVESGFRNATSKVGAQGFWQLMKGTATDLGLRVDGTVDERNDIYKATIVALRKLAGDFKLLRRQQNVASWVLTAAAYNWGISRVIGKIERGSTNYFAMQLNPETAVYVYKIVAIKELFEYPELYLKNFQYNVFSRTKPFVTAPNPDLKDFETLKLDVNKDVAPDDDLIKNTEKPSESAVEKERRERVRAAAKLVDAQIDGKYPGFKDGDSITIKLNDDLQTLNGFQRKGTRITGKGWIIDDRVFIDLGFNSDNVILYDGNSEQGIALDNVKNKAQVILRVQN
jgi:membrane-bound lytic murein transglycosylase D